MAPIALCFLLLGCGGEGIEEPGISGSLVTVTVPFAHESNDSLVEYHQQDREIDWRTWPRRGSVPLASADCTTDSCLENRERILAIKLGAN